MSITIRTINHNGTTYDVKEIPKSGEAVYETTEEFKLVASDSIRMISFLGLVAVPAAILPALLLQSVWLTLGVYGVFLISYLITTLGIKWTVLRANMRVLSEIKTTNQLKIQEQDTDDGVVTTVTSKLVVKPRKTVELYEDVPVFPFSVVRVEESHRWDDNQIRKVIESAITAKNQS